MKDKLLNEIRQYLKGGNIENASKRTLDFTWYYLKDYQEYDEALAIRKSYNLSKTLGQTEIKEEDLILFKDRLNSLLTKIEQVDIAENELISEPLIEVNQLQKTFNHISKKFKFGPVSITINKGDIVGVVGENGNGKTTFLRLIQEEITKDSGGLNHFYDLKNINGSNHYKRKNRTAFIPQRIPKWRGTLMENLIYFASIHGFKGKDNDKIVSYVIHRMGLTAFVGLTWSQISTGYKLRFELAKMLVWEPDVLILDEPLANLDIQATQNLLDDLKFFSQSTVHPIGILLTSQQLHEVEQVSDKVLFLRNGKPVFCGNQKEFEATRNQHTIEISANCNLTEIEGILSNYVTNINGFNKIVRITFSKNYTSTFILEQLIKAKIELTYYRDISNSTVQLFND